MATYKCPKLFQQIATSELNILKTIAWNILMINEITIQNYDKTNKNRSYGEKRVKGLIS